MGWYIFSEKKAKYSFIFLFGCETFYTIRDGNRAGWIGFGFGSDGLYQFDFLKKIGLGQFICCVYSDFLVDFDWIEGYLISDRIGSGRIRVRSGSDPSGFLRSGRVLPPLHKILSGQ
jgi:cellulose synthase/poly-beta-1,6-N-acetylglucosamine synthase-like glycosyltransferase